MSNLPPPAADLPPTEPQAEPLPQALPEPPPGEAAEATTLEEAAPAPGLSPAASAARLAALFPAVFTPGQAKPLKLRIQVDIQARAPGEFSRKVLSAYLQRHTTGTAYLRALVGTPQRFDLDGQPAGDVTDEHRAAATAELDRRRALHDARRAAEREVQRNAQREARDAARQAFEAQRQAQPPREPDARPPQDAATRPPRERPHDARRSRPPVAMSETAPPAEAPAREAPRPAAPPDDPARRDRANLLHSFETSTLTRANFCVLKRISEADLEAALVQARAEREQRAASAPREPRSDHRPPPRPDSRPAGRPAHAAPGRAQRR